LQKIHSIWKNKIKVIKNIMIRLIKNKPALMYKDWLVITDLHIGLEDEYRKKGYEMPSQVDSFLERLSKFKAKKLIILGDIKHKIPEFSKKEEEKIDFFLSKLKTRFKKIILIKGNHDGNIERKYDAVKEFWIDDIVFLHGHTISEKVLKARRIIAGHMHPVYEFKNHLGLVQKYKCFIVSKKVIILPAFTELSPGSNELVRPLKKYIKEKEILLLDHTLVS